MRHFLMNPRFNPSDPYDRIEMLRRVAAPDSGAYEGERQIALRLIKRFEDELRAAGKPTRRPAPRPTRSYSSKSSQDRSPIPALPPPLRLTMKENPVSDDYAKKFLGRLHKAAEDESAELIFAGKTKSGGGKFEVYEGVEWDDETGDFTGEFLGSITITDDKVRLVGAAGGSGKAVLAGKNASAEAKALMDVFHAMGSAGYSFEESMNEFAGKHLTAASA